jgi:2-polyprenyl-6-methoxyphenol hydroxylase-like FAD-dependent oxidoreductase
MENSKKLKVVVAGGGLVGLTTGIAFKKLGAEVTVCEQAPEIRAAGATIGLWKNALDVFDSLGMGEQIRTIGTLVDTWFFNAAGNRFRAEGYGVEDHSFLLFPRPILNTVLAQNIGKENIDLQSKVIGFEEQKDTVKVLLENGKSLEADLLIGADGVYSKVRNQLLPGYAAQEHNGHHVWRAMVPSGNEPKGGTVLTVGHERTRGGYIQTYGGETTWMINQFDSAEPSGSKKEDALKRAAHMNDNGWGLPLIELIERTPEENILHNQIMFVPELPSWVSDHVALIGDAAHGLSPHISAGGTLGIEDIVVLIYAINANATLPAALKAYESNRIPHYDKVRKLSWNVEIAKSAEEYAREYAAFSHWMLNDGYRESREPVVKSIN